MGARGTLCGSPLFRPYEALFSKTPPFLMSSCDIERGLKYGRAGVFLACFEAVEDETVIRVMAALSHGRGGERAPAPADSIGGEQSAGVVDAEVPSASPTTPVIFARSLLTHAAVPALHAADVTGSAANPSVPRCQVNPPCPEPLPLPLPRTWAPGNRHRHQSSQPVAACLQPHAWLALRRVDFRRAQPRPPPSFAKPEIASMGERQCA